MTNKEINELNQAIAEDMEENSEEYSMLDTTKLVKSYSIDMEEVKHYPFEGK